jgi:hypothetical protein
VANTRALIYDDWWQYYEQSNDKADQYWPHHLDTTLITKKGKEQADPITMYTAAISPQHGRKPEINMHIAAR